MANDRKNCSKFLSVVLITLFALFNFGGSTFAHEPLSLRFIENKNQWPGNVLYKAGLSGYEVFFERNQIAFSLLNEDDLNRFKELKLSKENSTKGQKLNIRGHAYYMKFAGSSTRNKVRAFNQSEDYINYFIGKDPSKWATQVYSYLDLVYEDLYPNTDLRIGKYQDRHLKYDFIVKPGGDPGRIRIVYEGTDKVTLTPRGLELVTSAGTIVETHPFAYQIISGELVGVACYYKLQKNEITFEFPDGFHPGYELVIDPTLIFSTYTGSTTDNWGFTATYDHDGNFYGGGIVFRGPGYPVTPGAFQLNYAGGAPGPFGNYGCDVGITKFNPQGTGLIYSTYLGGSGNEAPHSLVVNSQNELLVYGTTGSNDFPMLANSFQPGFAGGPVQLVTNVLEYTLGSDIFIAKFNPAGTALTGSTYVGGSGNDGLNTGQGLQYNYADHARGEIIVDENDFVYVASCTRSTNFPVSTGAFQTNLQGGQDACVFKLSPNLSTLVWGTYLGGTMDDAGYSLKVDPAGNVFVTGGTASVNFPVGSSGLNPLFNGGITDGYAIALSANGQSRIAGTFIGTSRYDQSYILWLDHNQNVYLYGQTLGSYPVFPATVWHNPGARQFIHKLNPGLDTTIYSTTFGTPGGRINISPTAFLVDVCENVYVSGWGGQVNTSNALGDSLGTTHNMSVSPDALQPTTDGSDFYFMVLARDATGLLYGTYFGGVGPNGEHVDGGTSRFDENGIIYQAVCASCGGTNIFPTYPNPGAWSNTNGTIGTSMPNCNMGNLKIEFNLLNVSVTFNPDTFTGCAPLTVSPNPVVVNGEVFFWDFGDGPGSIFTDTAATYTYQNPGVYQLMLIVRDTTSLCFSFAADTAYLTVIVRDDTINANFNLLIVDDCDSYTIGVVSNSTGTTPSTTFHYFYGDGNISTGPTGTHTYQNPGTYEVKLLIRDLTTCNTTDSISQTVTFLPRVEAVATQSAPGGCIPFSINFNGNSQNATSVQWLLPGGQTTTSTNTSFTFTQTGSFDIRYIAFGGPNTCNSADTVFLTVNAYNDSLVAQFAIDQTSGCDSLTVFFLNQTLNGDSYIWYFGDGQSSTEVHPAHQYADTGTYQVMLVATNPFCNTADTAYGTVVLIPPVLAAILANDTSGCTPFTVQLSAIGLNATGVIWLMDGVQISTGTSTNYTFSADGVYEVTLIALNPDACNGSDTAILMIYVNTDSVLAAFNLSQTGDCDTLNIQAINNSVNALNYHWDFGNSQTSNLPNPSWSYGTPGTYEITLVAENNQLCYGIDTARMEVTLLPPVQAAFATDSSGCAPLPVQLFALNTEPGTTWQWDFGSGNFLTGSPVTHTFLTPGNYTITLVGFNPNTCNVYDTFSLNYPVHPRPLADFTAEKAEFEIFEVIQLTNRTQPLAGSSYFWDFGDGSTSREVNPSHFYPETGSYIICLTALNEFNCPDSVCKQVDIIFRKVVDVPNAFSPNLDGLNDVLFVEGYGIKKLDFRIFNRWGELVFESNDQKRGWDGKNRKGVDQEMDVYIYTLDVEFLDGTKTNKKGNITLLR